jgi:hypothetical protein
MPAEVRLFLAALSTPYARESYPSRCASPGCRRKAQRQCHVMFEQMYSMSSTDLCALSTDQFANPLKYFRGISTGELAQLFVFVCP